ncbi:hypothetical protein T09_324 [Trichinella sp. T9]|nr:hypothetical protein T09_324 [Trichinella sp. T9]
MILKREYSGTTVILKTEYDGSIVILIREYTGTIVILKREYSGENMGHCAALIIYAAFLAIASIILAHANETSRDLKLGWSTSVPLFTYWSLTTLFYWTIKSLSYWFSFYWAVNFVIH